MSESTGWAQLQKKKQKLGNERGSSGRRTRCTARPKQGAGHVCKASILARTGAELNRKEKKNGGGKRSMKLGLKWSKIGGGAHSGRESARGANKCHSIKSCGCAGRLIASKPSVQES